MTNITSEQIAVLFDIGRPKVFDIKMNRLYPEDPTEFQKIKYPEVK
jgi:hypothetical protein